MGLIKYLQTSENGFFIVAIVIIFLGILVGVILSRRTKPKIESSQ